MNDIPKEGAPRIWHTANVPGGAFRHEVSSLDEARGHQEC